MDVSINAKTEWVLTFPTKRYYVNGEQVLAPFEDLYNGQTGSCDVFSPVVWDRESHQDIFIDLGDPPAPNTIRRFCWNSNVVVFQDLFESPFSQTDILGSSNKHLLLVNGENGANGIDFENGYTAIQFDQTSSRGQSIDSAQSQTYFGLPVIGFAIQNYANNNAQPGLLAQYGGSFKHKYKKKIVSVVPDQ